MTKSKLFVIDSHPAIPPSNLLKKWEDKWFNEEEHPNVLLIQAFQAGADEALDACCEWLMYEHDRKALRADRRPTLTSTSPTDEELCALYKKAYYESVDRQGPAAQAAALRAVLERWGK